MGNHFLRFGERIHRLGRTASNRHNRRNDRAVCHSRISSLPVLRLHRSSTQDLVGLS